MDEGIKVRLVRCPKCERLLPELPDYSVYQCGACGAVLRAKKKAPFLDVLSEKSNEERENFNSLAGKDDVSVGIASETERESDGIDAGKKEVSFSVEKTVNLVASTSPRAQDMEDLSNRYEIRGSKVLLTRLDQSSVSKDIGNEGRRPLKHQIDNGECVDAGVNMNGSKLIDSSTKKELGEVMPHIRNAPGSLRSRGMRNRLSVERYGHEEFRGYSRAVSERRGFPAFAYPDEGPSNYHLDYVYGCGETVNNDDNMDSLNRVDGLEQDRAQLLRKLDELNIQRSRSGIVADHPKEMAVADSRMVPPDSYDGRDIYTISSQPSVQRKDVRSHPYLNHSRGPVSSVDSHEIHMRKFYPPPWHFPDEIPRYRGHCHPKMLRRPSSLPPWQYPPRPSCNDILGQNSDIYPDPLAPYPYETCFHHPSSSCLHFNDRNSQVSPQVAHYGYANRRLPNYLADRSFQHHINPLKFGPRDYNPTSVNHLPLHSQDPQLHTRRLSDLDSDFDGISHFYPRRVFVSRGNKRLCHPIAGGAPFITCYKCFGLLKLPRKFLLMEKSQRKLQCGACSTLILLGEENKRIIISTQTKRVSAEVGDGSCEVLNKKELVSQGFLDAGGKNPAADNHSNSASNSQSAYNEANLPADDQRLNVSDSEKREGQYYSSSISSEYEDSPDSVIVQRDASSVAEFSPKRYLSPSISGSPVRDFCSSDHAASRFGKGNNSKRMDQEKTIFKQDSSQQNPVKDAAVETHIEVSFSDYINTTLSRGSVDKSKEEDQPKISKGGLSFFASLIRKSHRDLSRSNQSVTNARANVSVNGQPLPRRVVGKAEKLAGPIQPGEYWYDYRAGFWGVMGQPCLGLIPPTIKEFDYPMPEKCAAGNTSVCVNGRELNQQDLDLLASRGLPTTRNKSYIVEISGKVVDVDSGIELDGLGRLAPTVEGARRGFGMKVPELAD